jgi:hypothetical protein
MLRTVAVSLWVAVLVVGCSGGGSTPEERVRAVLAELEAAAEARDVGLLKPHVSEAYKDENGNDRRAVLGMATAHFMRNQSVYLLVRLSDLQLLEPGRAQVDAFVALAGRPIRDKAALPELHADLYRFGFALRDEDGEWRVTAADWHPATLADFQ